MRIGNIVRMLREQKGMTLAALADQVDGYDAGNLSRFERGLQDIDNAKLAKIAEILGVTLGKLYLLAELPAASATSPISVGECAPKTYTAQRIDDIDQSVGFDLWDDSTPLRDDEVAAPFFMEVEMAAGTGSELRLETRGPKLRFSKRTLRKAGVTPENAVCAIVNGDSMEPVIPSRQAVGIDTGVSKVTLDGDIYAIEHGGLLRVKRLYRMPGGKVRINSYNSEYPDETVPERDITVLGRIFWWSVLR